MEDARPRSSLAGLGLRWYEAIGAAALGLAAFLILYFAAQLARGLL